MDNNEEKDVKDGAEENATHKVTLDSILVNEIGQFGKFQLRAVLLTVITVIFASWGSGEYVFTTARISTRCVIPECDGPQPEWSPYWLANAVPATGSSSFDNCQRFGNSSAVSRLVQSDTCPSNLFDRNTLQPCDDFVYENTHSVAYDFNLACDEWSRSVIGTVRTFGTLTALPLTGYVSDRFGRRVALVLNAFNTAWMGVVRFWSNTYVGFMMSEFFEATFGSGGFQAIISYRIYLTRYPEVIELYIFFSVMELMGPKYRVVCGAMINTCFAVGLVFMGLIAWAVPNWRYFTLTLYIPQLLIICYFWLMSESVRWYMSKGRFEESEAVLRKVAKMNGRQISEKTLQALRETAIEESKKRELEEGQEPWLVVQVFRHKPILLRVLISPVWWVTTTFIYYGLSINAVNMSGNRYLNYVAVSAVEIPGYWCAVLLLSRIGRKAVLITAFWICAACQIAYIFMPDNLYGVSLTVYLIAKFAIAMVVTSIYIYTMELYPTKHRHSLFAYSSMIGRIGTMTATLTPALGAQWFEELPFVLFAFFALLSGALVFLTPETRDVKLPDTFEEASQIGVKKNKT